MEVYLFNKEMKGLMIFLFSLLYSGNFLVIKYSFITGTLFMDIFSLSSRGI